MNKTEKFWDRLAKDVDPDADKPDQENIDKIEKLKKYLKDSDVVLDYGCARGGIALDIADKVKAVQGIDISSKMIAIAKKRAETRKIQNVSFAQAQIFDTSLKPESFDVILAFNVIHLVEEPVNVIQTINRLLKPGGLIISETPCLGTKQSFFGFILSMLYKIGILPYVGLLKMKELETTIAITGFKITETNGMNHSNMTPHLIVAKKL